MAAVQTTFNSIDSQIESIVAEVLVIYLKIYFLLKFKGLLIVIYMKFLYFSESIIFRKSI